MNKIQVTKEYEGKRLDVCLVSLFPEISRARLQKMLKEKAVLINNSQGKASYTLKPGDYLYIDQSISDKPLYRVIDIPILYEDDDCLVVNKPVGLLTHSKGAYNPESTVATFVTQHSENMTGERAGIVHRLDRATSGVMICAKTLEALSWLQKQFSQRKVKKTYLAIVKSRVEPSEAIIDIPIERNPKKPQTFRTGNNGKPSMTHYKVIQKSSRYELIKLKPETGRTHQLRVHLKHFNHPIVGDALYGGQEADRLYLHAYRLEITLPNRRRTIFEAPIPPEFNEVMQNGASI